MSPQPPRTTPLADLHRHLDGSLRESTLLELAAPLGVHIPEDLRFSPGMGLGAALSRFQITLSVLQTAEAVRRVASEICEDAASNHVTTLEIRFAPHLHTATCSPEEIVDAALEGVDQRAGIILCGLYGDPPDLMQELVNIAIPRPGVTGIDLAGGPSPSQKWSMEHYKEAFTRARDHGIGRTVHAGEGRPPEEIMRAVEILHAERIGHGTTLLDNPKVVDLVREKEILIEACPTSNVHTGIVRSVQEHPLSQWLDLGIKVCLNTDNTLLSSVDAPEELRRVRSLPGMTEDKLQKLVEYGHQGAFRR